MKKGIQKGAYGYINTRKKTQLIKTISMFFIAAVLFVGGYLLNNHSKQNIFTIIAVLCILPAARYFISFIVLFPYRSVERKTYEEVEARRKETDTLLTDLVFTSKDKIMNLSFLLLKGNQLIGLSEHKKADDKYMAEYLQNMINGRQISVKVIIKKDKAAFLKEMTGTANEENMLQQTEELKSMLFSLIV